MALEKEVVIHRWTTPQEIFDRQAREEEFSKQQAAAIDELLSRSKFTAEELAEIFKPAGPITGAKDNK